MIEINKLKSSRLYDTANKNVIAIFGETGVYHC